MMVGLNVRLFNVVLRLSQQNVTRHVWQLVLQRNCKLMLNMFPLKLQRNILELFVKNSVSLKQLDSCLFTCVFSDWRGAQWLGSCRAVWGRSEWANGTLWAAVCSNGEGKVRTQINPSSNSMRWNQPWFSPFCSCTIRLYSASPISEIIHKNRYSYYSYIV